MPSLKEKNRYLVFEMVSETKIKHNELKEAIINSILSFLGELETAKTGLKILPDYKKNKGIIKITHLYADKIKTALILIKNINKKKVIIKTTSISGTLKKARQKMEA